jgi:hypothetical protein
MIELTGDKTMRFIIIAPTAMFLAACSANAMLGRSPDRTYHSAKARSDVAECLMDRMSSGDFRVHRQEVGHETQVAVTGIAGTYFLFTLRDSPNGGTDAEMRRANTAAPGLSNGETCF